MKQDFQVNTKSGLLSGIVGRTDPGVTKNPNLIVAIHGGTYNSGYFDIRGYSLVDKATAAGFDIVALDRPGYGKTVPLVDGPAMLHRNALRIAEFLPEALANLDLSFDGIILIGHSMGGVIASSIASSQPSWPLKGIIGTGFAQNLPAYLTESFAGLPEQYYVELPTEVKDELMFGPRKTLAEGMPQQSHVSNTHMPRAEAIDIAGDWATRAPEILGRVTVPVYYKLAEFEKLWDVSDLQAVASMYKKALKVDTGIFSGAGHCIDFHNRGSDFHDEILRFASSL